MHDLILSAAAFVCAAGGFLAGARYTGSRLPHLLAEATDDELRRIAHATRQVRQVR